GTARAKDGDGNGTAVCDAGAFERAPGTVQFSSSTYSASETTFVAATTLTRTGGTDGAVGVIVNLTDGTATAPLDYSNTPIVIPFADGDAVNKPVNVPIN